MHQLQSVAMAPGPPADAPRAGQPRVVYRQCPAGRQLSVATHARVRRPAFARRHHARSDVDPPRPSTLELQHKVIRGQPARCRPFGWAVQVLVHRRDVLDVDRGQLVEGAGAAAHHLGLVAGAQIGAGQNPGHDLDHLDADAGAEMEAPVQEAEGVADPRLGRLGGVDAVQHQQFLESSEQPGPLRCPQGDHLTLEVVHDGVDARPTQPHETVDRPLLVGLWIVGHHPHLGEQRPDQTVGRERGTPLSGPPHGPIGDNGGQGVQLVAPAVEERMALSCRLISQLVSTRQLGQTLAARGQDVPAGGRRRSPR